MISKQLDEAVTERIRADRRARGKLELPYTCLAKDLREGDVIRVACFDKEYACCTVKQVEREKTKSYGSSAAEIAASPIKAIHLIRPFIHHQNFTYTGGVITYLGYEEYFIWPDTPVTVLQETDIPEVKR